MDVVAPPQTIADYYLKIQALTPVTDSTSTPVSPATTASFEIPTISIIIFLAVLIVGAFALLLAKSHQINKMLVLMVMAFVLSAVPLTMKSFSTPKDYRSQAGPQISPKNLIISQVLVSSFTVSWDTDQPESGAIRIGTSASLASGRIIVESPDRRSTHHELQVTGLSAHSLYYFNLLSGTDWFNDQGKPIEVKTPNR